MKGVYKKFLNKSQNCNATNFCIISTLFHHKYNDENFSKVNKEQVSPRNQFSMEQVSPRNQFPCRTSFPLKSSYPS